MAEATVPPVDMAEWTVPGYTALRELGTGGFGRVVLARHDASGTLVAIKYLAADLLDDHGFATSSAARPPCCPRWMTRTWSGCTNTSNRRRARPSSWNSSTAFAAQILSRQGQTTAEAALGRFAGFPARPGRRAPPRRRAPGLQAGERAGQRRRREQADGLRDRGPGRRPADPGGHAAYAAPEQMAAPRPSRPRTSTRPRPPSTSA